MFHAMIMAGGGGTRFWPRSRTKRPKQFLTFAGDRTLLQGTFDRIAPQVPAERTWVITGEPHVTEARKQLPELPAGHVVGEPFGRDTAACIGLGAARPPAEALCGRRTDRRGVGHPEARRGVPSGVRGARKGQNRLSGDAGSR